MKRITWEYPVIIAAFSQFIQIIGDSHRRRLDGIVNGQNNTIFRITLEMKEKEDSCWWCRIDRENF
jgi:hypothetical protein